MLIFFITSLFGSYYLDLSVIKIVTYFLVIFTIFQSVKYIKVDLARTFLVQLTYVFILISFLFIYLPYGYYYGDGIQTNLFMGILSDSQAMVIFLVPLLTLFIMFVFENILEKNYFNYLVILIGLYEIYLSQSRTALISVIIPILIYMLLHNILKKRFTIRGIVSILSVFLIGISLYLFNGNKINDKVTSFINKTHGEKVYDSKDLVEMLGKRYMLIEASKNNFLKNIFTGIGFNVQTVYAASGPYDPRRIKYIPGTNIIYNKPLEKGNLYFAVFEEGGLFVGIYFLYILYFLFINLFKKKYSYGWVTLLSIYISFNGEAAFFSPGGGGPFQVAIIALLFHLLNHRGKKYV